jgi:hypothetical protein
MGRLWVLVLAVLGLVCGSAAHAAERKVALVIGNSGYTGISRLTNPGNDARLLSAAAKQAGFDVILADDLTIASFQKTLRDFRIRAEGADVAMVYYAGHGMEGQGQNWLIPVDARLDTEFDLPYEAISIDRLLEAVSGARVRVLVLDACRNNPFGNRWKRGVRAVPSGLAGMELDDVLVIYAAAPGQVALDGKAGNSPFAASLAKRMVEPGLPLQLLAGAVRDDVMAATGGNQRPYVSASITGTPVYLMPQAAAPAASSAPDRGSLDALMWQGALSANSPAGYDAYLKEFPKGLFAGLARANLDKLKTVGSAPASSPPAEPQLAASSPAEDKKKKKKSEDKPAASPPQLAAAAPVVAAPTATVPPAQLAASTPAAAQPKPSVTALPNADLARANAALVDKAPLPVIPAAPAFPKAGYPACRDDFQKKGSPNDKIDAVNQCTVALDQYYRTTLTQFRNQMSVHQDLLSRLYTDKVGGRPEYTPASQQGFFAAVNQAHADANPDGKDFAEHRAAEERYRADRAYLQGQYQSLSGSGGKK